MRQVYCSCPILALFCLAFLVGCGQGDVAIPGTAEDQKVAAVVSSVNDAASDQATFESIFVSGAAPEDRAKYFSSKIEVVGTPEVSGDTATAVVKISQGDTASEGSDTKTTKVGAGEVTWTLKKEGDVWKIQDAPLP